METVEALTTDSRKVEELMRFRCLVLVKAKCVAESRCSVFQGRARRGTLENASSIAA